LTPKPSTRPKFNPALYCKRPAEVEPNSPLPKFGSWVQHAMIMSDGVIYQAMESLKPVFLPGGLERGGQGRLLRDASITKIAAATAPFTYDGQPMPRRTVAHRLEAMTLKGIIIPWEESRAKTSPVGTSWRLPNYDEILGSWAANPKIGTVPPRAFYVFGKGKRLFSPEEMVSWGLDHAAAARLPNAQATRVRTGIQDEVTGPAAASAPPAPEVSAELDLEPLKDALIDACNGASIKDAEFVWREVVKTTGKKPAPPVEDVAEMAREIGRDWRKTAGSRKPLNVGLLEKRIGGKVERWLKARAQTERQLKDQKTWAREARINEIADAIRQVERPDTPEDDRGAYRAWIAANEPDEVEAARRVLADIKARSA